MKNKPELGGPGALTIAGFDPSSGAGITADLTVFALYGIFATSAITALTVQSTMGVRRVEPVAPELLAETLACLQEDLPPAGIKIGMLGGLKQVRAVVDYLRSVRKTKKSRPWVVLDPVLRSSSGSALLDEEGTALLRSELIPLADVITPNAEELGVLTGEPCDSLTERERAARRLMAAHPGLTVLVTGGDGESPDDVLVQSGQTTVLGGERVETASTHGTGCVFSSALLANLIHGESIKTSAVEAKKYVVGALHLAFPRGRGRGPTNTFWPITRQEED